jgi:hypothetical protein
MRRTIVITEPCDAFGIKLYPARWRGELGVFRIGAEVAEQNVFLGA